MRRLAMVLTAILGLTSLATPAGGVAGFGDVDYDRFYTEAVQWMVDNDITTGTSPTCFSPDDPVTRGQAAAFMWRMEGFPQGAPAHPFTDVVADWQQQPVSWMYAEGITTGTSPTTFGPDATLTRGQMAALIHRAAGNPPATTAHPFVDVAKDWQQAPVSWMAENGITTGTSPTTFSPDDAVTRGQFATFAWRWREEPAVVLDHHTPLCGGIDDFDGILAPGWISYVGGLNSQLRLDTHPGHVAMTDSTSGWVVLDRAPVAPSFVIETKMKFQAGDSAAEAGLASGSETDFVRFGRGDCDLEGCSGDAMFFGRFVDNEFVQGIYTPLPPNAGEDVYLSLWYYQQQSLWVAAFSLDGQNWEEAGRMNQSIDVVGYGILAIAWTDPGPLALFDWFKEAAL